MKPTKVLIVSPCQGGYGGIEAFVLAVAAAVRREPDMEVRICLKRTQDFTLQPDLKKMLEGEDVIWAERGADRDLTAAIKWADVVHLQNAPPDVAFVTKWNRKPLVMTIHNYRSPRVTAHRLLWQFAAGLADERWYNSQFVWNTWEPRRKRKGSRKVPTVSKLPEGWTPPNERNGFAFVGRWIANKGIDTLVDAYALAKLDRQKWPLVLMGEGPLRKLIEYAVQKRGIEGVTVLGFVDEETKTERMKNARWVVVPPNTREDFGLTAVEARHLGVPCIITRDGGLPEAGGRQALICQPNDPKGLAALLEQAASMDEAEYVERATRTREELGGELEPMDFYARSYRRIVHGE
ncbi:MAG TPA: glycosyltransferase [Chthoniobacterales bacterium]|nr:glycosyltransferase [Chthoniobacterales bacterium]